MSADTAEPPYLKIPLASWLTAAMIGGVLALGGWVAGVHDAVKDLSVQRAKIEVVNDRITAVSTNVDSLRIEMRHLSDAVVRLASRADLRGAP